LGGFAGLLLASLFLVIKFFIDRKNKDKNKTSKSNNNRSKYWEGNLSILSVVLWVAIFVNVKRYPEQKLSIIVFGVFVFLFLVLLSYVRRNKE
jgi:hypothetical protein